MTVAVYARVSTAEQSLDRQLQSTHEYANETLDRERNEVETLRDKSTGTNNSRSGYRNLMEAVEAGDVEVLIVKSVSRIARSIRDLDRTAGRVTVAGAELHIIDEGLVRRPDEDDPYQNALFRLFGVFAELEAEIAQKRTREGIAARQQSKDYHHGRPPLGFEKEGGHLIEGVNFGQVCAVLEMVKKGELSKRKAARELETSRTTINRALERAKLYGLKARRY